MFNEIKKRVSIVDAYDRYCPEVPLKARGENDFIPEDDCCPWHGGHGSFHIAFDINDPEKGFAKCFSSACTHDETPADVIEFVRRTLSLESPKEAAQRIIADFELGLVFEVSTSQKIFNEAAKYYQDLFLTTKIYESLDKKTPMDYQKENRGHKESTLLAFRVGWTDNAELCKHLALKGFSVDEIIASGLGAKTGTSIRDKLPKEAFVYTAYVGGRPSRFTFKTLRLGQDGKPITYQLKKEFWLNGVVVMGQDSVPGAEDVAVVEGENDALSLVDMGWDGGIIVMNGQPGRNQYEYIKIALKHKRVHTFYDADDAGDKYRLNTWAWADGEIHQYRVPDNDEDVDLYIQRRRNDELNPVERLMDSGEITRPSNGEADNAAVKVTGSGQIVEKDGCYFGFKQFTSANGDVKEQLTQLTNFTIKMKTVLVHRGDRIRELEFTRDDGYRSGSVYLNSSAKSSMRLFKEFCAKSGDALFLGTDSDLNNLWMHIAATQRERVVNIPEYCGYVSELNMWLFRNVMINNATGAIYQPDERGIFWTQPGQGIMPQSISSDILQDGVNVEDAMNIPMLREDIKDPEEFMEWQGEVIRRLADIVGMHEACSMMGWANANAYSTSIFQSQHFFPMLLFWGRHGKGKTTILQWLLATYDMLENNKGYMTVSTMEKSTVGFQRKMEYYSSLPITVDELRADFKTKDHYSMWRGMFNRAPRTLGTPRQGVVKLQKVRANLGFGGQDAFPDAALQSRCISMKTSNMRSDERSQTSYRWLSDEVDYFPRFGYHWILESTRADKASMEVAWEEMKERINAALPKGSDVGSRTKDMWKIVGWFGERFMNTYFPGEEYMPWMLEQIRQDVEMQTEVDIVTEVWSKIASHQVGRNPDITLDHVDTDGKKLYIWWPAVMDILDRELAHLGHAKSTIRTAMLEEPYYEGSSTRRMGLASHQRRVLIFNLENAPEVVKQIATVSPDAF